MSIKPAPTKYQLTFNSNNYFKDGSALLNSGNQRLHGSLQTTGASITYGDETVYGDSTLKDEPLILTITDPQYLQSNNLVTKSYVDSIISNYPQVYTFGKAYNGTIDSNFLTNLNNYVYVRFLNTQEFIQSLYIEVIYDVQKAKRWSLDRSDAIQRRSVYNIVFYKSTFNTFDKSTIELIDGDNITRSFGDYTPLSIGTQNGKCLIRYQFIPTAPNINEADDWYATYGISIKILKSNPVLYSYVQNANSGGAYFATD